MKHMPLPRIDANTKLHDGLLKYCRLSPGQVWHDPEGRHRVGCLDAVDAPAVEAFMEGEKAVLAVQDPPYNMVAFGTADPDVYVDWCARWIDTVDCILSSDGSLYVWLGADQQNHFQPLADFMIMMRKKPFKSRSFITLRNQRGYGTQKNWMAVRQELLYYTRGNPVFHVAAEYTDIPKILRGYYKDVAGVRTENLQRGRSETIRAGNVWVDIQQVFYRMEENVSGCFAQKPCKAIERIVQAGSCPGDCVVDFFCHSGTTLVACERSRRRCFCVDHDPVFCEITIRRLERLRATGKTGWQAGNPFENELENDLQAVVPSDIRGQVAVGK
ncbi:MAG: site-specific DNA-methyltransferase [Phycisphaerae bacterium]|nr:site-specific DNA-methyltransferase [Phycisphaerae bacterium]